MITALSSLAMSISSPAFFAQADARASSDAGGAGIVVLLLYLVVMVVAIAGLWKVFEKAGQPGWAAIVPIYNVIVMLKVCGKPLWWVILLFIPFVNFVAMILIMLALAKSFGKGVGYAIGCILLGFIFIPMLGFGSARYVGPQA